MSDSGLTILGLIVGVALLYLGSWIRRRAARRARGPQPGGPGPQGR